MLQIQHISTEKYMTLIQNLTGPYSGSFRANSWENNREWGGGGKEEEEDGEEEEEEEERKMKQRTNKQRTNKQQQQQHNLSLVERHYENRLQTKKKKGKK